MACPTCGGADHVPIAPGYWRCTSTVERATTTGVPVNPAVPDSGLRPHQQVSYAECGSQYLFGPVHLSELRAERLFRIREKAIGRPALLCMSLARIVLGQDPETEYEGAA